jgi:hypothetical protein
MRSSRSTPKDLCSAHAKRSGQPCRRPVTPGRTVCHLHGGATPRGIASPHWRGRGFSKDLPTRLADRFQRALEDPQLLELSSELALLDCRLGELVASLPPDPAPVGSEIWEELRGLIEQRRKLVETERRLEETLQGTLTLSQAMALLAMLQAAVAEVVTDYDQRRAIADRLRRVQFAGRPLALMAETKADGRIDA